MYERGVKGAPDYIRLKDVLLTYWEKLGGKENVPHEEQIDPDYLSRVWDDCFLVEIKSNGDYHYDYLGKNLIEAYGEEIFEDEIRQLISTKDHAVTDKFDEVIKTGKPVSDEGEFDDSHHLHVKYRQLLLPFSDDQGKVKFILGGMRWRVY